MKNIEYQLLTSTNEIEKLSIKAREQGVIGLDTEFMRERTYFTQLCLIQVSVEDEYFLIDALELNNNSSAKTIIADILSDKSLVKILHSSFQDIEVLSQFFNVTPKAIFDTQVAAGFCGYDNQIGYANLVLNVCEVELDKSQTRTNWLQRPLSEKQLEYATNDVVYLQQLFEKFSVELKDRQRYDWFLAESDALVKAAVDGQNPELAYQRLNGSNLSTKKQVFLVFLATIREQHAQQNDIPRSWVLKDADLYTLAHSFPTSHDALSDGEVQSKFIQKKAHAIIEFVNSIDEQAGQVWERSRPLTPQQKQQIKQMSSAMNTVSEQSGIARSLIANRKDIESFVSGLGAKFQSGWRAEILKGSSLPIFSGIT